MVGCAAAGRRMSGWRRSESTPMSGSHCHRASSESGREGGRGESGAVGHSESIPPLMNIYECKVHTYMHMYML